MQGKIIKGIAGFYYVDVAGSGVYECKAKGIFRKEKIKPLVGDNVEIEVLDAGANIIVAGSAVFKGDPGENTKAFMEILRSYE